MLLSVICFTGSLILVVFEGVQKERMQPEDMYILSANGSIISTPSPKPYPNKPPKCTDCAPLFMKVWFCRVLGSKT